MRLIISLFLVGQAVAQSAPKTKAVSIGVQNRYLAGSLSISAETVGPNFKGHDITAIIGELRRSPLATAKSEFETTQEYGQRIETVLASKNRQYAFALDGFNVALAYDADAKVMKTSVTAYGAPFVWDANLKGPNGEEYFSSGFSLRSIVRPRTTLIKNARGAWVSDMHDNIDEFGIVISKDDGMFAEDFADTGSVSTRKAVMSLDMDAQTARGLKAFLRVALICTLVDPTVYVGSDSVAPTRSHPIEIRVNRNYILMRSDELWIYDQRSGNVLGKFLP
jgi:hypothetical protein